MVKVCSYNYPKSVEVSRSVIVRDTTPPVISLLGSNPISVEVNTIYSESEPGATAIDSYNGDISDNIPSVFPKCGPKTALKYYEDQAAFQTRLQSSETFIAQYNTNKKIVDFNEIPVLLKNELFTNCEAVINEWL